MPLFRRPRNLQSRTVTQADERLSRCVCCARSRALLQQDQGDHGRLPIVGLHDSALWKCENAAAWHGGMGHEWPGARNGEAARAADRCPLHACLSGSTQHRSRQCWPIAMCPSAGHPKWAITHCRFLRGQQPRQGLRRPVPYWSSWRNARQLVRHKPRQATTVCGAVAQPVQRNPVPL